MARYEDVIASFMGGPSGKPDGAPQAPQVPGGPMSPAQPEPPTTPGLQLGVNGRPVGTGGPPLPMAPQGPNIPDPISPPATEKEASAREEQKSPNMGGQVLLLNRLPRRSEILGMQLPPGVTIRTPYGDLDQEGNVAVTPEYEQKHKEAIARARQKFGPSPWAGMAGAPEMDIQLGGSFFNPFTNSFGRAD